MRNKFYYSLIISKIMKHLFSLCFVVLISSAVFAKGGDKKPVKASDDSTAMNRAELAEAVLNIEKTLHYQHGEISLEGGIAKISIPQGFKFLNKEEASMVITKIWGNPSAKNVLGMIMPENSNVLNDSSFAFVVQYSDMGFVKDDDADKINYDDLLKDMQKGDEEENKARIEAGGEALIMKGWAQKPFYDKTNRVLHWAMDLQSGSSDQHTLNYNVRVLGRKGVLVLNAVANMRELPLVNANIEKVLHIVQFTEGNKYSDYNPSVDKVAAWGIGGLVAGKVLAKVGIFALIAKFGKLIFIAFLGGVAAIRRFFMGKKKEDEEVEHNVAEASVHTDLPEENK
jgi:uncharacterized membrane-anchored protein